MTPTASFDRFFSHLCSPDLDHPSYVPMHCMRDSRNSGGSSYWCRSVPEGMRSWYWQWSAANLVRAVGRAIPSQVFSIGLAGDPR